MNPLIGTILLNISIVSLAVLLHYQFLYYTTRAIRVMQIRHRYRIVFGVFASLLAHTVEIWVFALPYYLCIHLDGWGHLAGNFHDTYMDCVYFSFTTFTTLGFGDIEPSGLIRYLTGIESLTGLILITWSASLLYYEMHRHWNPD